MRPPFDDDEEAAHATAPRPLAAALEPLGRRLRPVASPLDVATEDIAVASCTRCGALTPHSCAAAAVAGAADELARHAGEWEVP